jgi:hypothetical protein
MYLAYYHLLRQTQHIRWNGNKYVYYCNIGMIKRYLDKQIKLENPQVLVEVKPRTLTLNRAMFINIKERVSCNKKSV